MNDRLYFDHRLLAPDTSISWDMAHHIFTRYHAGLIAVVAENPVALLAAVKKQWNHVLRQVQQERSRTLRPARIMELSQTISTMQSLRFIARADGAVCFGTAAQLEASPPACRTLYVTYVVSEASLKRIAAAMPENGVVVLYSGAAFSVPMAQLD